MNNGEWVRLPHSPHFGRLSVNPGGWAKADQPWAGAKSMWYVYVLRNETNGDLYKGFTGDLKKRILQHKSKVTKTTKKGEWKLVYYEGFINERDARKEELFLKTGKGRERLKYLFGGWAGR